MIDTCCLLGTKASFCLYVPVMDFKMHVTDMYSKVLIFRDPHHSWLRSYFRAENLKLLKSQAKQTRI